MNVTNFNHNHLIPFIFNAQININQKDTLNELKKSDEDFVSIILLFIHRGT